MARTLTLALLALSAGCGASSASRSAPERDAAGPESSPSFDASTAPQIGDDAASAPPADATESAPAENEAEGAEEAPASDAPVASRFITGVVSFDPGECAGFGAASMPGIVEGPPYGGGTDHGGTDVVSLGGGGSIVVSFAPNAIVDGPGADFIVFENPFWVAGNSNDIYAEPGEVSVSDDGVAWHAFPCSPTQDPHSPHGTGVGPPYGECAGWHVVLSNPTNGISPLDPSVAGGDAFDLAAIGVTHARYIRIVDKTNEDCPESGSRPNTNGFDLDAISIVNAESP